MGYRIVRMSSEFFGDLLTQGTQYPFPNGDGVRIVEGLPPGAKLEAVSMDRYFDYGAVALRFSHPDWEPTPEGCAIPELRISCERFTPPRYVVEDSLDGESVRIEAPTAKELDRLRAEFEMSHRGVVRRMIADVDHDTPTTVKG